MGGSSKTQTVGYWYGLGLHLGLSHGPVDALLALTNGDRRMWTGSQTESGSISVNAPELFGGEEREGGVVATIDVMMGEDDQEPSAYLAAQLGTPQPAYLGLFGLVIRATKIAANNPYIKPIAAQVKRILSWTGRSPWLSWAAAITVDGGIEAMNPAHIVYEALTNEEWGLGLPDAAIDDASFTVAANKFYQEGLGLCFLWSRQDTIEAFIQTVVDHACAIVSVDPRTGLFQLHAIREVVSEGGEGPQLFDESNILRVENFERASPTEAINELTVSYIDAETGKTASATVQHLANIQAQGGVVSQTRQYPGIPTFELAVRTAMRDLRVLTSSLARARLVLNRDAYNLQPGDVIRFSYAPLGIENMVLRVGRVDYGSLTSGAITVDAVQDVFSLPSATYVAAPGGGWEEPTRDPTPSTAIAAFEVPYRELLGTLGVAETGTLPADAGYVAAVAQRPSGLSLNYELRTRAGAAEFARATDGDWCPTGELAGGVAPLDTTLVIDAGVALDAIESGTALLLGDEIVRVESVDLEDQEIVVARGCCDTVPRAWGAGTRIWAFDLFAVADSTQYVDAEEVDVRVLTRTSGGLLPVGDAPEASVTLASRAARPYPPGKLRISDDVATDAAYPADATGELAVTWAHRDRVLQQDQLIDESAGDVGPEAGTTYTVRWYLDDVLEDTETGISGNAATPFTPSGAGVVRVEVEAVRDGLASWQHAAAAFAYTPATP